MNMAKDKPCPSCGGPNIEHCAAGFECADCGATSVEAAQPASPVAVETVMALESSDAALSAVPPTVKG